MTADLIAGNQYAYDGEGRICAVQSPALLPGGQTKLTGYMYDADGNRVAKGNITNGNINSSSICDPTVNGLIAAENYVLGPSGEELSMLDGSNNWQRTNVFGGGKLVGTYDVAGLHFHLEDPLGTRRMQLSAIGQPETEIQSLPYGDQLYSYADANAPPTADDATPLHFTGKERDAESGNDYFGARYYASSMGRFMSPDWSAKEDPVPYAKLDDPQSLNLYAYVGNNPLDKTDPTGHDGCCDLLPSTDEVNAVVEPLINSAEGALETGAEASANAVLGVAGLFLFNATPAGSKSEVEWELHHNDPAWMAVHYPKPPTPTGDHTKDARPSTKEKHEAGESRKSKDRGGEKGDARRRPPRKRPDKWKGPWPPPPPPPPQPPKPPSPPAPDPEDPKKGNQ